MKKIAMIPNIKGHHSIISIRTTLTAIDGVEDVRIDITTKEIRIVWEAPASWEKITAKLAEIGYPVQE